MAAEKANQEKTQKAGTSARRFLTIVEETNNVGDAKASCELKTKTAQVLDAKIELQWSTVKPGEGCSGSDC